MSDDDYLLLNVLYWAHRLDGAVDLGEQIHCARELAEEVARFSVFNIEDEVLKDKFRRNKNLYWDYLDRVVANTYERYL